MKPQKACKLPQIRPIAGVMPPEIEDRFTITPAPSRQHTGFFAQVRAIAGLHGGAEQGGSFQPMSPTRFSPVGTERGLKGGRGATFVRCRNISSHWHHQQPGSRSVIITHAMVDAPAKTAAARDHLRYIQRDGTAHDGTRGQLYCSHDEPASADSFLARSKDDDHHFRLVISPQDGAELSDLTTYTRELMQRIATDLGTELDWVAANHYNTSHPHVHLVIRGRDDSGRELLINGAYLCHGMRERAVALASLELGPLTVAEERHRPVAEIDRDRLTSIDRGLIRDARDRRLDLRHEPGRPAPQFDRALRLRRLGKLMQLGLATQIAPNRFELSPGIEGALNALAERADIMRSMQDAVLVDGPLRDPMTFRIHHGAPPYPITGRVIDRQLTSAVGHNLSLVVDAIDGRTHHVSDLEPARVEDLRIGSIIDISLTETDASFDHHITGQARDGVYRPSHHIEQARFDLHPSDGDHEGFVAAHVRRLEALEQAGIVRRIDEDQWAIPEDFAQRARRYDQGRNQASCRLLSAFDLSVQIHADGATWLDHRLLAHDNADIASHGFGDQLRGALDLRTSHHIAQGDAIRHASGAIAWRRNLLTVLRARELARVGHEMAEARQLSFHETGEGGTVRGRLTGSVQLHSGRFAVIAMAREFTLVPWRPILERGRHREMLGIMRDGTLSWSVGRQHQLEI